MKNLTKEKFKSLYNGGLSMKDISEKENLSYPLVRYWINKYPDDKIINLDKLTYAGHLSSTTDFSKNKNYTFIKGDICDTKLVNSIMKKITEKMNNNSGWQVR